VWQLERSLWSAQKDSASGIKYFPQWMFARYGMNYAPLIKIEPDTPAIVHHWHTWGQPVYVAHPDDPGLRWNLIDWIDNPRMH
jgi:hypothetical protein